MGGRDVKQSIHSYISYNTTDKTWATPPTPLFHRAITISYGSSKRDCDRRMKQGCRGGGPYFTNLAIIDVLIETT